LKAAEEKSDNARGYKHDLKDQMKVKRFMSDRERDQDKLYAALESA
jgi:hypothetical protein